MKKLLLLGLLTLITITACQQENELVTEDTNLSAKDLTNLEYADGSEGDSSEEYVYPKIYIQFKSNTSSRTKNNVRINSSELLGVDWVFTGWTTCTDNIEIWTFRISEDKYDESDPVNGGDQYLPDSNDGDETGLTNAAGAENTGNTNAENDKDTNGDSDIQETESLSKYFTIIDFANCD